MGERPDKSIGINISTVALSLCFLAFVDRSPACVDTAVWSARRRPILKLIDKHETVLSPPPVF